MTTEQTPPRADCPTCGKRITIRKNGTYRHHRSHIPEYPGSAFKKLCPHSGRPINPDRSTT